MMVHKIDKDMISCFETYLKSEEKSRNTQEKYIRDVCKFMHYLSDHELTKDKVIAYKKYLMEMNYAYTSINSMLASLNSFLKYLGWMDCCVRNLKVQRKIYVPEQKLLRKQDVQKLIHEAEKKKDRRLSLLIQTLCSTGIRISELEHLTRESLCEGEFTVSCKGKVRTVLITKKLQRKLLHYAQQNQIEEGPIFLTNHGKPINRTHVWRQLKNLCSKAQINSDKVFPHNFRHLFARTFYELDKDIAKLADVLGHSSINTTRIYIMTSSTCHRNMLEQMALIL